MAQRIGALVMRAGRGGELLIPNLRSVRDDLKAAIWGLLKSYYVGPGQDAFRLTAPLSPFALLLRQGIEAAIRIQAERQAGIINRVAHDEAVVQWLTGPRPGLPVTELAYDPFHTFVDPNGYRLSDRIWRTSIEVRSRIDLLLEYHIGRGTSAVRIAELLEDFLTPGAALMRTMKPYPPPYGTEGSYAARRLARTEITAAAGRATINASQLNPFVSKVRWRLSASHRSSESDECDQNATGGPNGDGIYSPESVPTYPNHAQCKCSLLPVVIEDRAQTLEVLRSEIEAGTGRARALRGAFNPDWLTQALLNGTADLIERALLGEGV